MRVAKVTRNIHNMITLVLNGIFRRQNLEFCRQIFGVRCTRRGLTKKIYAYVYIFRKAPSRTWRVREGALRKIYAYVYIFRKAPSRTWRVREGALRKIYAYVYIFRKAPSRTWRVREGALRARMCALVTFKFSRVTN